MSGQSVNILVLSVGDLINLREFFTDMIERTDANLYPQIDIVKIVACLAECLGRDKSESMKKEVLVWMSECIEKVVCRALEVNTPARNRSQKFSNRAVQLHEDITGFMGDNKFDREHRNISFKHSGIFVELIINHCLCILSDPGVATAVINDLEGDNEKATCLRIFKSHCLASPDVEMARCLQKVLERFDARMETLNGYDWYQKIKLLDSVQVSQEVKTKSEKMAL